MHCAVYALMALLSVNANRVVSCLVDADVVQSSRLSVPKKLSLFRGTVSATIVEVNCSNKRNLKAVFQPVVRMWIDGRPDDARVVRSAPLASPMYGAASRLASCSRR